MTNFLLKTGHLLSSDSNSLSKRMGIGVLTANVLSVLLFQPSLSADPEPRFFRISEEWNNRFAYQGMEIIEPARKSGFLKKPESKKVLKGEAAKYFQDFDEPDEEAEWVPKPPPELQVSTGRLRQHQGAFELELEQVVIVDGNGIQRYVSSPEDNIDFYLISPSQLQMKGAGQGRSVVHIWDQDGRLTIPIQVVPQKNIAQFTKKLVQDVQRSDSFKFEYTQNRSAFYTGNGVEDLGQASLAYTQGFAVTGDTPYGPLSGEAQLREANDKTDLTSISARLTDGHIGGLRDFDLTLMDETLRFGLLTLPSFRHRGVTFKYNPDKRNQELTTFFGREQSSILGTLAPSSSTETLDSYVGGINYEFDLTDRARWQIAYFKGYGQSRLDELNSDGMEFVQTYKVDDHLTVRADIGSDGEKFAHKYSSDLIYDTWRLRSEYRDIAPEFFSVIGNASGQGEQGLYLDAEWELSENFNIRYITDIVRDRRFFIPGEKNRFNIRQEAKAEYRFSKDILMNVEYQENEQTSDLSPFRDRSISAAYYQTFDLFDHPFSAFAGLRHQDNQSILNTDSVYRRDTVTSGLNTSWGDFNFSVSQNASILEEVNLRSITHPRSMVYSVTHQGRFLNTPINTDFSVRYTDEEETEAIRSFMVGEDRVEIAGELSYQIENMEFFINGRYDSIKAENAVNEGARAEAEITTGIRYVFDTDYRWEKMVSLKGYVFNDLNNDGQKQPDETGIPQVSIYVGEDEVVTDGNGYFESPKMPGKRINMSLDMNTIPSGLLATGPITRSIGMQDSGLPVQFGFASRSVVGGTVFNDLNLNGLFDRGEFGIKDIRMRMDGSLVKKTDRSGRFRFMDVDLGKHKLELIINSLPKGYLPLKKFRQELNVQEGVQYQLKFPLMAERMMSGQVYVDLNRDGIRDDDEPGVAGAKVILGTIEGTSDADGYYILDNLPVGVYTLTVHPNSVSDYQVQYAKDFEIPPDPYNQNTDIPLVPLHQ